MNAPAQGTIDRPHERAASRARLDKAHSTAADRANDRRQTEDDTPKKINKGGSGPRCDGQNYAAQFPAQAAKGPEGRSSYLWDASGRREMNSIM
jgi:hypothetical protein